MKTMSTPSFLLSTRAREGKIRFFNQSRAISTSSLLVIAIIIIGGYIFFTMGSGGIKQAVISTYPPDIEITSMDTRSGSVGLDYVGYVDVSVYNKGGKGTITVWVEVTQGTNTWKKSKSVYLDYQDSANLTFEFREVTIFGSWRARAGVTY